MQTNDRMSSPIRNMNGSPMANIEYTQEVKLLEKSGNDWVCEGWYSNFPETKYAWRIPESTLQEQFTKI